MLIAQSSDQLFPRVGSSKTGFLLDRVHLEQQCRAIQVAGIAGGSDHICRKGCLLNQICRQSRVGFQASGVLCKVAENKQGYIFLTVRTAMDGGCLYWLLSTSVLNKCGENNIFRCFSFQLSEGLCVQI
jgi:hypothetical protein